MTKLSEITSGTLNAATDMAVVVRSGTTDLLVPLGSLASQSGTFSGTSSGTNTGNQTTSNSDSTVTVTNGATDPVISLNKANPNGWTGQQYFAQATLTDAASISWDLNTQQAATVTLGGNRTLANPTNMQAGATYILKVVQDGTGSRTLAYGTAYKWPAASAPTLTTTAGAVDILTFYSDGTNMYGVAQKAFA